MGDWRQRIRDEITSLSREAAEKRQCLVPMIAQLPMPDEESEVKSEVAAMYEALSGTEIRQGFILVRVFIL